MASDRRCLRLAASPPSPRRLSLHLASTEDAAVVGEAMAARQRQQRPWEGREKRVAGSGRFCKFVT